MILMMVFNKYMATHTNKRMYYKIWCSILVITGRGLSNIFPHLTKYEMIIRFSTFFVSSNGWISEKSKKKHQTRRLVHLCCFLSNLNYSLACLFVNTCARSQQLHNEFLCYICLPNIKLVLTISERMKVNATGHGTWGRFLPAATHVGVFLHLKSINTTVIFLFVVSSTHRLYRHLIVVKMKNDFCFFSKVFSAPTSCEQY